MELSKEVHSLLERIKKLSRQAHKNESFSSTPNSISPIGSISQMYLDPSVTFQDEPLCTSDQLINLENMDFSDDERWLYVSPTALLNPYTGDLEEWLHQDIKDNSITKQFLELEANIDRKYVDTRTFTRPKKRICRPALEQFTESLNNSRLLDSKEILNEESETYQPSAPVQFKLNEPAYNTSFDRILATATDSTDSFTNMSPPSLMNSLCSSSFTTLMDSGYVNQEVPNVTEIENDDPNNSLNDTYDISTYTNDHNNTFQKNKTNLNATNTSTYRKPKTSQVSLKSSCPDINKTFQKNHDCSLDLTFQKLSDSQPNLTEDLKRTILNQSMELMNAEVFHSARSGSADSLDERSSSISNSSRGSTKILDSRELETLAKVQEKIAGLNHAISTPTKPTTIVSLDGDVFSPIRRDSSSDLSRSGSDLSETCITARSGFSKRSSPARSDETEILQDRFRGRGQFRPNSKPEMIVKPMEMNRTVVHPNRPQSVPSNIVRPKVRVSGLPRPTMGTGIPRPMSRIPGPKSIRPPNRPSQLQRHPPKSDWMDGCY